MLDDARRRRASGWLFLVPLGAYLALALIAVVVWDAQDRHELTGDEPHYLVVASAIAHDHTFENSAAYAREFRTREIYPAGLAAADAEPTPTNTHAKEGPHGLYNVHNIGLPLLLAMPFAAGGVLGAKVAMVALNGTAVVGACWVATGLFTGRRRVRAWATGLAAVAAPFVFAGGQLYPDVLAGAIVLYALCRFATIERDARPARTVPVAILLACAPWLQIKFAAIVVVLAIALAVQGYRAARAASAAMVAAVPLLVSGALLAFYNWYAFGAIGGPYGDEALEASSRGAMVLAGLHIDANQGWVWQAPVWLVGCAALAWLVARRHAVAALTVAAYVILIVPNAFHPNWYGGDSFSGRFFWSAAVVLLLPTVAGLVVLAERYRRLALAATAVALVAVLWQYAAVVLGDGDLLRRRPETMASAYPVHAGPLPDALPQLYAVSWAWRQPVTWAALAIVPAAAWLGAYRRGGRRQWFTRAAPVGLACVATLTLGAAFARPERAEFDVIRLQHEVGERTAHGWAAPSGTAGFVAYAAFADLDRGRYEVRIVYRTRPPGSEVGTVVVADVVRWPAGTVVDAFDMPATGAASQLVRLPIDVADGGRHEFRLHTTGTAAVELDDLTVVRLD